MIISPFAPLFKHQIDSGNVKKLCPNMTDVKNVVIFKNEYTFLNKGPHNNIFETTTKIIEEIKQIKENYESVLISCGAYSILLAKELYDMGKNVCMVGGDLQTIFGVLNGRTRNYYKENNIEIQNKECWILEIPNEYKPNDYMKIENGCYW